MRVGASNVSLNWMKFLDDKEQEICQIENETLSSSQKYLQMKLGPKFWRFETFLKNQVDEQIGHLWNFNFFFKDQCFGHHFELICLSKSILVFLFTTYYLTAFVFLQQMALLGFSYHLTPGHDSNPRQYSCTGQGPLKDAVQTELHPRQKRYQSANFSILMIRNLRIRKLIR